MQVDSAAQIAVGQRVRIFVNDAVTMGEPGGGVEPFQWAGSVTRAGVSIQACLRGQPGSAAAMLHKGVLHAACRARWEGVSSRHSPLTPAAETLYLDNATLPANATTEPAPPATTSLSLPLPANASAASAGAAAALAPTPVPESLLRDPVFLSAAEGLRLAGA